MVTQNFTERICFGFFHNKNTTLNYTLIIQTHAVAVGTFNRRQTNLNYDENLDSLRPRLHPDNLTSWHRVRTNIILNFLIDAILV